MSAALVCCLAIAWAVTLCPSAKAAGITSLLDCSSLGQAIEQPDGSIVALGVTAPCGEGSGASTGGRWVLVGLSEDGSDRPEFADGGFLPIRSTGDEASPELIQRADGFLLASGEKIRAYDADGQPDQSFGTDGQVTLDWSALSADWFEFDATGAADGSVLLSAQSNTTGNFMVRRYDSSGQLDSSFGEGGSTEVDGLGSSTRMVEDSQGRVVIVGTSKVARLLASGEPDLSFGPDNDGFVEPHLPFSSFWVFGVKADSEDAITAYVAGSPSAYSYPSYAYTLDNDGMLIPGQPVISLPNKPTTIVPYGSGIATGLYGSRGQDPVFALDTTQWDSPRKYWLSPGDATIWGITPLRDGSLLAVGSSHGPDCQDDCQDRVRMALAKLDPETGDLVTAFGTGGTRLIPANNCRWGEDGRVGDWRMCRVRPPRLSGLVRYFGVRKRRPSIVFKASLGPPPDGIWGTRQKLVVKAPKRLKLRRGGFKGRVSVKVKPNVPLAMNVAGRKITVLAEPRYSYWDSRYGATFDDSRLNFRIEIRRGALKRIPRPKRLIRKPFALRGTFVPAPGGMAAIDPGPWFSPSSSAIRVVPSPQGHRARSTLG